MQCMSPRRNWDSPNPFPASVVAPPPPEPKGGEAHSPAGGGWESLNSDDWRKSLALCLLCAAFYIPRFPLKAESKAKKSGKPCQTTPIMVKHITVWIEVDSSSHGSIYFPTFMHVIYTNWWRWGGEAEDLSIVQCSHRVKVEDYENASRLNVSKVITI